MILQELYDLVLSKGVEYIKNPESRAQIVKITFVVIMKLFSMIRNRISKKNNDEHIECNCNSCKVWKAKLDDVLKNKESNSSNNNSTSERKKILPSLFNFMFSKRE